MGFDYEQLKSKENSDGDFWASYSDLFMVLSLVFLLLYVVAGLRSGTSSMQQTMDYKQLQKENADYKEQIKAYNTLKDDYLSKGASSAETETYKKLMGKLSLLQEDAKTEKETLRKQAGENAEKEKALNQYQQIVRNIINTNMLSAARMKRKSKVIEKIDHDLENKKLEVKKLNSVVALKEEDISKRKEQIKEANEDLARKTASLQKSYEAKKLTASMMKKKLARIKDKAQKQIEHMEKEAERVESQLNVASASLQNAQKEIQSNENTIMAQGGKISKLESQKNETEKKVADLKQEFKDKRRSSQKEFNEQMRYAKISARLRDKKIQDFRDELANKKAELDKKVSGLQGRLKEKDLALTESFEKAKESEKKAEGSEARAKELAQQADALGGRLAGLEGDLSLAESKANRAGRIARYLASKNKGLSKNLRKAKAQIAARKGLINKITQNLRKAGLNAKVDPKTGDVILSFGNEYFDTGKFDLKPNMKRILRKFMPVYSKSLLSDRVTAEKIRSVELVGFASPTYKGKYVNPDSLSAKDREAVSYNLNLSYYRAKSIFDYIFNTNKMVYQYQKQLVPLVKVVGRSFFAEGSDRNIASQMSRVNYCREFDCKKAQRVIIRFDLGN